MATLEERANRYFSGAMSMTQAEHDGYIQGASDQRKIDVEKALKVYEELMTCSGYYPEVITAELARMRNKLED